MKKLSLVISIILTAFVFSMSFVSGSDSNNMSLSFAQNIMTILDRLFPANGIEINNLNSVVRKLAHIFEYSILAISWFITVKLYKKSYLILAFIGLTIAISDEIFQRFAANRGSSIVDSLVFDFLPFILISGLLTYINNRRSGKEDIVASSALVKLANNKIDTKRAYQKLFEKEPRYKVPFTRKAHFIKLRVYSPEAKGVNGLLKVLFFIPFPIAILKFLFRIAKFDMEDEIGMSKSEILNIVSAKGIKVNVSTKNGDKVTIKTI